MAKYDPLERALLQTRARSVAFRFGELETLLGSELPASARVHRPWWANSASHVQAAAWLAAGFEAASVDLPEERVVFLRDRERELDAAERALGVSFEDRTLLDQALTHASACGPNNQALATLGDRIHNVWVARKAFRALSGAQMGLLTEVINATCKGSAQEVVFFETGLEPFLVLGGSVLGEGGSVNQRMASTAWEAVVAAVEIDQGIEAAEALLERWVWEKLDNEVAIREP